MLSKPLLCSTILTLSALATPALSQQELSYGQAADMGMSGEVLQAGAKLFEQAIADRELMGAVILVARRGKIVLHEAYGWRDKDRSLAMQKDSLFRMASNTKPVVATAVLQLIESGKVNLDDNMRAHISSFDNHRAAYITVRQLLSHTGGFRIQPLFFRPLVEKSFEKPSAPSLQIEVDRFAEVGAEVPPGTSYSYSNAGFNSLGAMIELRSDSALKNYLRSRIYEPLGMKDSCNHESDADHERMSAVFGREGKINWQPGDKPDFPFPRASGGMISTAWDYAIFCQMYLNQGVYGDQRILSSESVAEATKIQTAGVYSQAELTQRKSYYGLGWAVDREGVFSHSGSDGTAAWIDPERELIGLVFTQHPAGKNPREQFRRVVEAACEEEPSTSR